MTPRPDSDGSRTKAAPFVSVILASRNGADTLAETLAAHARLTPPEGGVETILVDNGSTDRTAEIMRAHAAGCPDVTVLTETRPGKSCALNAGIEAARGRVLVFTDDDALPDPDWLVAYVRGVRARPGAGVYAGPVVPLWQGRAPGWLDRMAEDGQVAAATPADLPPGPMEPRLVKGPNFAVRAAALGGLRFDEGELNFGAGGAGGAEDVDLAVRVAALSGAVFVPGARVDHIVQCHEMRLGWLLRRRVRIWRASAVAEAVRGNPPAPAPRLLRRFVMQGAKGAAAFALMQPERGVRFWLNAATAWGMLEGRRALGRRHARPGPALTIEEKGA